MLIIINLIIALLLGFVLGRLWEIRQRLVLSQRVDEQSRPVEIRVATKASKLPPKDDSRLAALDRELKDLLKAAAVQTPRSISARRQ